MEWNLFKTLFFFTAVLFTSHVFARSAPPPEGSWKCRYNGMESRQVCNPPPQGCHPVLEPRAYDSAWHSNQEDADEEAYDSCQLYSQTACQFQGCRQYSSDSVSHFAK